MGMLIGVSVAAAGGLLLLLLVSRFVRCRREAVRRLNDGSQIAATDKGNVEYARLGDGPVVLSLHGGLGGWDQGLVISETWLGLAEHGFTVVSPSRPGYLRTPLEVGRTPEAAADALAALLDTLAIETVLVLGTSGGGATALQLALRHPDRTRALVLFSAISGRHVQPGRTRKRYGRFLFSKSGAWLLDWGWWVVIGMVKRFPRLMVTSMFRATTTEGFRIREEVDYVMAQPQALASIQALMETQFPLSTRKAGLDNDLETYAHLPAYPLEQIACPTLVVHGRFDGNVPFSYAEAVAGAVSGAKIHVVEGGGHLVSAGPAAAQVRAAIVDFIKEHSSG